MQGIYKITNLSNAKFYIGSSQRIKSRFTYHRNRLNKGIHDNQYLQASWSKYGQSSFAFEVVEIVQNPDTLLEREQWYLDNTLCLNRNFGYNIAPKANRTILAPESIEKIRKSRLGSKASEETRRLLSQLHKGVPKPHNSKPLGSNPKARKIHQCDRQGNVIATWACLKEAQQAIGISYSSISGVCNGHHKTAGGYVWKYAQ